MATIKCIRCGAPVEFDPSSKFVSCSYCSSQIYIDKSGAGFYYYLVFKTSRDAAEGIFRRWCAGSKMAKDLPQEAKIFSVKAKYFPVYTFKRNVNGQEVIYVEPAKNTTLPGMHSLKVPPGDAKIFDSNVKMENFAQEIGDIPELITPDLDMTAYMSRLPGTPIEQALVFFPIWDIQYNYKGKIYQVIIEGSGGEIFSTEFPTRPSTGYIIVAGVGFGAFLAEGIAFRFISGGIGMGILAGLLIATAVGIFVAGYYVASKL